MITPSLSRPYASEIQRSMDDMKKEHSLAISDVKKSEIYMKERDEWKQKYEDLLKEFRLTSLKV